MGGGETDAQERGNGGDAVQKIREINRFRIGLPQIAVDVLAQEGHLLIAPPEDVAGLPDDGMGVPGALRAAGIRDDAVGADVVAAAHDGDEGGDAVGVHADRGDVAVGLLAGQQHVDLRVALGGRGEQARQAPVRVRTSHDVHFARLQQGVLEPLGHAAEDAHDHVGAGLAVDVELADAAQDALLGVVADRAGVGQDHVGLVDLFGADISFAAQDGEDHFRVRYIHLAAVCLYVNLSHIESMRKDREFFLIFVG